MDLHLLREALEVQSHLVGLEALDLQRHLLDQVVLGDQ